MAVRATTVAIGAIGSVTAGAITKVAPKLGQIVTAEVIRGIRNTGRKINDACASDIQNRFNILYNKKHNNTNSSNRYNGNNRYNGCNGSNNGNTNPKQRNIATLEDQIKYSTPLTNYKTSMHLDSFYSSSMHLFVLLIIQPLLILLSTC